MEYGFDCQQPFSNYKNYKPYYGGPLCYYIKLDKKYFGIIEKSIILNHQRYRELLFRIKK